MRISTDSSDAAVLGELGDRLRALRLKRNLSQGALAEEAGVGRMTVQRLEEGRSASLSSLIRVLRALGALEGLDRTVAPPSPSPLEELERRRGQRQRAGASGARRQGKPRPEPWRWGDESPEAGGE